MFTFNKQMGACNEEVLFEFDNVYESPFYHALRKEGAAILDEKLHRNGMLLKYVIFFAPCQAGGFKGRRKSGKKSHSMDPDKLNGVHFMPER
jgi:hypothetical protein